MRSVFCLMLLVLAGALPAQMSANLNSSVPDNRIQFYLFEVDHGGSATAVNLSADLTTTGASGLIITLFDLDNWSQLTTPYITFDSVTGPGNVMGNLALPARTGVHQVGLTVETDDFGPDSPYTGTVDVDAGTITQVDSRLEPYVQPGSKILFDRIAQAARQFKGSGGIYADVNIDFGAVAQTATFSVMIEADEVTQFELIDMSQTPATVVYSTAATGEFISDAFAYTTLAYDGVRRFRLRVTKAGGSGYYIYTVVVGNNVTIDSVSAPAEGGGGGGSDSGCSTGEGASPLAATLLAACGAFALRRRRDRC